MGELSCHRHIDVTIVNSLQRGQSDQKEIAGICYCYPTGAQKYDAVEKWDMSIRLVETECGDGRKSRRMLL